MDRISKDAGKVRHRCPERCAKSRARRRLALSMVIAAGLASSGLASWQAGPATMVRSDSSALPVPPPGEAAVPQLAGQPLPAAAPSQTSNYFNPSVSVIGNLLGVAGTNRTENLPSSSLRESEVGLQAIVDPYARADFFLSFGEEGVDVEEGFATFTSLPWDLLVKAGRMRTSFGKINTLHLHVLPWPDEPLPVVNLLGG